MSVLTLLVGVLVFAVVYWAAVRLLKAFEVGEPIRTVVIVLIVVLCLLWLLKQLGLTGPVF